MSSESALRSHLPQSAIALRPGNSSCDSIAIGTPVGWGSGARATDSKASEPEDCASSASADGFPRFKSRQQCECKRADCESTGRALRSTGHNKGCDCNSCLNPFSSLARSGPIKQTSRRHKDRPEQLKEGSPEWLEQRQIAHRRSRGICEAKVVEVCQNQAVHLHHIKRRSQGGSDRAGNLLDVCDACHDWIHGHPEISYLHGWLAHSWEESA